MAKYILNESFKHLAGSTVLPNGKVVMLNGVAVKIPVPATLGRPAYERVIPAATEEDLKIYYEQVQMAEGSKNKPLVIKVDSGKSSTQNKPA